MVERRLMSACVAAIIMMGTLSVLASGPAVPAADEGATGGSAAAGDTATDHAGGPEGARAAPPPSPEDAWWDLNWSWRMPLTFNNSGSGTGLKGIPLLVMLTPDRLNYSDSRPGGADIRFIDAKNGTILPHHIEEWNASGESFVWVNVTWMTANSTDDTVWMYYGNPGASDAQDIPGTYDDRYLGVWHLNETTGPHADATGNGHPGSPQGSMGQGTGRHLGGCDIFDGLDDYVDLGDSPGFDKSKSITLEAWFNIDTVPSGRDYGLVAFGGGGEQKSENLQYGMALVSDGDVMDVRIGHESGNGQDHMQLFNTSFTAGGWHHIAAVRHNLERTWKLFVDGAQFGNDYIYDKDPDGGEAASLMVGRDWVSSWTYLDGMMDEVRISTVPLGADWIRAQYLSMSDALITYGEPQPDPRPYLAQPMADRVVPEDTHCHMGSLYDHFSDRDTAELLFEHVNPGRVDVEIAPNGSVSLAPLADWSGVQPIEIRASDGTFEVSGSFNLTVLPVDDPPVLGPIGALAATQDQPFWHQATGDDDADGGSVTFHDNSSLFDIDPRTGVISFTPGNLDVGVHPVSVSVRDTNGSTASEEFNVTVLNVNDPPVIMTIGGVAVSVGAGARPGTGGPASPVVLEAVEDTLCRFNITVGDPDEDAGLPENFTYWTNLTASMTNIELGPTTGVMNFTPSQHDVDFCGGVVSGRLRVRDAGGLGDEVHFEIHVENVNDPPTTPHFSWGKAPGEPGGEGDGDSTLAFAGVHSLDEDGDEVGYMWDFGDGDHHLDDGSLNVSHRYWGSGTYMVTLTAFDSQNATASYREKVTVIRRPIPEDHDMDEEGSLSPIDVTPDLPDDDGGDSKDLDTDGDGIPDSWERARGLDPNDPTDALADPDMDGRTYLDEYLDSQGPADMGDGTQPPDPDPAGTDGPEGGDDKTARPDRDDGVAPEPSVGYRVSGEGTVIFAALVLIALTILVVTNHIRGRGKRRGQRLIWDEEYFTSDLVGRTPVATISIDLSSPMDINSSPVVVDFGPGARARPMKPMAARRVSGRDPEGLPRARPCGAG